MATHFLYSNKTILGEVFMPPQQRVGRHIVRPDIDTWFVRLSPPTVLELQL